VITDLIDFEVAHLVSRFNSMADEILGNESHYLGIG
jgi:hypothetical protein